MNQVERLVALIANLEDEGHIPHILIVNGNGATMPMPFAAQPAVLFNISSTAVVDLTIDEDGVSFRGRFGGKEHMVYAPIDSIIRVQSKDGKIGVRVADLKPAKPKVTFAPSFWDFTPRAYHSPVESSREPEVEATNSPQQAPQKFKPVVHIGGRMGDGQPKGKLQAVS